MKCCPKADARKITREEHEDARQVARDIGKTKQFAISMWLRMKVEMLYAHLKRILGLGRLRLRGPCGANDEFLLAATAQNLRKLAKIFPEPQKLQKPDKKGARAPFRAPLSALATRCFSTKSACKNNSVYFVLNVEDVAHPVVIARGPDLMTGLASTSRNRRKHSSVASTSHRLRRE